MKFWLTPLPFQRPSLCLPQAWEGLKMNDTLKNRSLHLLDFPMSSRKYFCRIYILFSTNLVWYGVIKIITKKYSLQHSVLVCVWTMYSFMFWKPYFGKIITSVIKYSSHFQRQKQYMKILVEKFSKHWSFTDIYIGKVCKVD